VDSWKASFLRAGVYPEKATEQANGEEVRNNVIHIPNIKDKLLRRKLPCSGKSCQKYTYVAKEVLVREKIGLKVDKSICFIIVSIYTRGQRTFFGITPKYICVQQYYPPRPENEEKLIAFKIVAYAIV
jgi:hypothetical protein